VLRLRIIFRELPSSKVGIATLILGITADIYQILSWMLP
jgi:hypothetical protein